MRTLVLTLFISFFLSACQKPASTSEPHQTVNTDWRMPGEFESQDAVWMALNNVQHLADENNEDVIAQIIRSIIETTSVKLIVKNDSALNVIKPKLPAEAFTSGKIKVIKMDYQEFWVRDMGPSYLVNGKGGKKMVDLNFNTWGYIPDTTDVLADLDETVDERIAKMEGLALASTGMISEGGNHEFNGKGVMLAVAQSDQSRNPNLTLDQMAAIYKQKYHLKKVIWLKKGVLEDEHTFNGPIDGPNGQKVYTVVTTNGHIDEHVRFIDAQTIAVAEVDPSDMDDPIAVENKKRIDENLEILRNATDQDEKPFKIVRMPMPRSIIRMQKPGDGTYDYIATMEYKKTGIPFPVGRPVATVAAASYLNFLITNGLIIAQKFYRPGMDPVLKQRDEQSKKQLESLFPDRKVIQIDATAINFGGGGIHCITKQEPSSK
ncbi:MAG: agmatine deiminase family protein [Bacteroidetes Order II. Incertae sedis bacterium]|nr:agmatine deiminase family protein [Bacteroidetes Order II. bacterium]